MAKHIYHYNMHAEQRFFLGREHRDNYDLIALNGNIVSHTPSGVAAFLATAGKDFFIDPQTHAFQHATIHLKTPEIDEEGSKLDTLRFKPSIKKLAERLGNPFSDVIANDKPLSPNRFFSDNGRINDVIINEICEKVITFETRTMIDSLDEEDREFIGSANHFQPEFIVAPYFYLSPPNFNNWLNITIACYKRTKEISKDLPTYMNIVIARESVYDVDKIIEPLRKLDIAGITFWIDDFLEEELDFQHVAAYKVFINSLKNIAGVVYNLHGGYLSTLLCHEAISNHLDGVGHSINYGENRAVIPIGGGIPMARFYFPSIHSRLRHGDAVGIIQAKNWVVSPEIYCANVCKCVQCTELMSRLGSAVEVLSFYGESNPVTFTRRTGSIVKLEYPTKEAKQASARHYLYNKAKEFNEVKTLSFDILRKQLSDTYSELKDDADYGLIAHLDTWMKSL
ncbi:MAG: hypothetical protein ACHQQQ_12490 [Bacteroidota bacterium]